MDPSGQEQNPYAYALNNPILNSDPSGLVPIATLVKLADAILTGKDIYDLFAAEDAAAGVGALISIACGTVAGLIAAPTVVGTVVAVVGCEALGALADYALSE